MNTKEEARSELHALDTLFDIAMYGDRGNATKMRKDILRMLTMYAPAAPLSPAGQAVRMLTEDEVVAEIDNARAFDEGLFGSYRGVLRKFCEVNGLTVGQPAGREVSEPVTLPPKIAAIIERLHTQDNRITSHPLFAVQEKRVIGGLGAEYADKFAWISDGSEVDAEEAARLDALRASGERIPDGVDRVGYIEKWEFVTGCMTEQGCKDFIACNGHNLKEPRIYAYSGYRNAEFIAVREWLMSLMGAVLAAGLPEGGE